jgi:catechol 2,3-dioxygenase-like lactoylglutathione lyase family enzyme
VIQGSFPVPSGSKPDWRKTILWESGDKDGRVYFHMAAGMQEALNQGGIESMQLHHMAIVCRSRENADLFYRQILGLEELKVFELDDQLAEQIFRVSRGCEVRLYGNEHFKVEVFVADLGTDETQRDRNYEHHCLEVPEREAFAATCEAHGMAVQRIPRGQGTLIFVTDPDGNRFEIKEIL